MLSASNRNRAASPPAAAASSLPRPAPPTLHPSSSSSRVQHRRRHSFHTAGSKRERSPRGPTTPTPHSSSAPTTSGRPARAKAKSPQDSTHFKWILWASFVLTINAGFINTITLHTMHGMPSAHVTGIVARASNYVANGEGWNFLKYLVSYICFVVDLGRMYGRALFILAAVQGLALIIENSYDNSILFVWMCTYSCGLQNSMTSKYSGNAVRTTHLTGASTDMGIALGHILKGRYDEWWKVQLHGVAVVGFFIGGVLGYFAFERFEHAALLVNVCLSTACAVIHVLYVAYHERMPVISVLESRSDIRIHKHRRQISDPQHGRSIPRSPRLRSPFSRPQPQDPPVPASSPTSAVRLDITPAGGGRGLFLALPSTSLSSTVPTTTGTTGQATLDPSLQASTATAMHAAVVHAASPQEREEGEEEESDDDEVWGHSPASSVHGLEEDDYDAVEPTPEEEPYPLFESGDIAGLPSDMGTICEEATERRRRGSGVDAPRDEEAGWFGRGGSSSSSRSPTAMQRAWDLLSPRSQQRRRQQQQRLQLQEARQGQGDSSAEEEEEEGKN